MASKNEKRAAELGMTLKEYKKTDEYKASKADKKSQEKQTDRIKDFYSEEKGFVKEQSKTDIDRLKEDLNNIFKDLGVAKTRAIEDYQRNIKNIEENKEFDVSELTDYVDVARTRGAEDLETALNKEQRRYNIELDRINEELANTGLTFSERRSETQAQESGAQNIEDIQTASQRSFQDIARYEAIKTKELELKYSQQTDAVETKKERTLEDIINEQQNITTDINRKIEDIGTAESQQLRNIGFQKSGAISDIDSFFDQRAQDRTLTNQSLNLSGI